jgi:molybdopterin synthase sulfur carrier subunit
MKIRVKLFAVAKELVGQDVLEVDVPTSATVGDVREAAGRAHPALSRVLPHALWAIDATYATDCSPVLESSEIALIPPVSGG